MTNGIRRVQVSGAIGTALFYGLYNLLLPILEGLDIFGQYFLTVTWTVSYLASIGAYSGRRDIAATSRHQCHCTPADASHRVP